MEKQAERAGANKKTKATNTECKSKDRAEHQDEAIGTNKRKTKRNKNTRRWNNEKHGKHGAKKKRGKKP